MTDKLLSQNEINIHISSVRLFTALFFSLLYTTLFHIILIILNKSKKQTLSRLMYASP